MRAIEKAPACPVCSSDMIKRQSRKTQQYFWGCSRFPKCRGTRAFNETKRPDRPTKQIQPNKYQIEIFRRAQDRRGGNFIVKAGAGTGKTSTCEHAAFLLPRNVKIAYIVYNAHVRDEALPRMPEWVNVMTSHQKGLWDITAALGRKPEIDDSKVYNILRRLLQATWEEEFWLLPPVKNIVGLLKNLLLEPTPENIAYVSDHFGIEMNGSFGRIVQLAKRTLQLNNAETDIIDFDDMLYLPIVLDMPISKFDIILLDEVQDFNAAQIELVLRSVKDGGRVIAVGDSDQSLYGFRGADIHAMERVQSALNASELPLSITYRCPRSHVRLINSLFPEIPFEAAPNAIEGELLSVSYDRMLCDVRDGDMVLCRTNAPLVEPAFELIRQGVKAVIRGRDIGKNLQDLMKRFDSKSGTVEDMLRRLTEYRRVEMAKLLAADKTAAMQALDDKVETIIALADGCRYISEVVVKIEEVFSDKKIGIVFSTVHKAKGLEADNIYILSPHLFPHPMATKDWEKKQERNCQYVAFTRAKRRLAFVGPIPHVGDILLEDAEDVESDDA